MNNSATDYSNISSNTMFVAPTVAKYSRDVMECAGNMDAVNFERRSEVFNRFLKVCRFDNSGNQENACLRRRFSYSISVHHTVACNLTGEACYLPSALHEPLPAAKQAEQSVVVGMGVTGSEADSSRAQALSRMLCRKCRAVVFSSLHPISQIT
jgi:hypothetical protein